MDILVTQPSAAPTRKLTAAVAGGSAATIFAWIAQQLGLDVPAGVEAAFAVLLAGAAGYLARDRAPN